MSWWAKVSPLYLLSTSSEGRGFNVQRYPLAVPAGRLTLADLQLI
jgi:hypothetical protein